MILLDAELPPLGELRRRVGGPAPDRPRVDPVLPFGLNPAQRLSVAAIRLYRRRLSHRLGARCMYEPSCSEYALLAIAYQGAARGWASALARLARCRPAYEGTIDYPKGAPGVPDREHRP